VPGPANDERQRPAGDARAIRFLPRPTRGGDQASPPPPNEPIGPRVIA
jgi:hypothetical protein